MKKTLLLLVVLNIFGLSINAQNHKCGTMKHWEGIKDKDSNAELRMQQLETKTQEWIEENTGQNKTGTVITIPVVVHILYNASAENISDAQIASQMEVLNEDFRLLNFDSLPDTHPFSPDAADCLIEFCLAQQDPSGNATTGITRTYTDSILFTGQGFEKFDMSGGKDNWEPTKYLNIWVCNLAEYDGTLGYAAFPSDLGSDPELDGVVIDHRCFGNLGTAGTGGFDENDLGRTATHEVGHWLNLRHIWGDAFCGDDLVSDTPPQEQDNGGCPSFPYNASNSCGSGADGEMYMNYMDYVDDACMVMFTYGQSDRMDAALALERSGLLTSDGCSPATGISKLNNQPIVVNLFPNPSKGHFFVDVQNDELSDISITVTDVLGKTVYQFNKQSITKLDKFKIDISIESNGIYFVKITTGNNISNKRIIINK